MGTDAINAAEDRAAWLARRRTGIGASEASAALGLSPFETPLALYLRKLGELPDAEENEAMRWGTRLEPLLADAFEEATGAALIEPQTFSRSGERPHLFATVDGMTADGDIVELKTISAFKAGTLGDDDTDQLPPHWLLQAAQQMYVFHRRRVHFGVLVGGNRFRTFLVERDDALEAEMLPRLDEFWGRVQRREAPDAEAADVATLAAVRPAEGLAIDLASPDVEATVASYRDLCEQAKALEAHRDALKARLLQALGEASVGRLGDGTELRRKLIRRKGYTVEPREFVEFRIVAPKGGRS